MPQVPSFNASNVGPSMLEPSKTNLLLAASEMAKDAERSMPQGQERPKLNYKNKRSNRPLRVVK